MVYNPADSLWSVIGEIFKVKTECTFICDGDRKVSFDYRIYHELSCIHVYKHV